MIFVHGAPVFEKKGSANGHGAGMATADEVSAGYAQAIDGGAHDAARVTCAFAARIDASGRLLVRSR